jgi:hypothetical protein
MLLSLLLSSSPSFLQSIASDLKSGSYSLRDQISSVKGTGVDIVKDRLATAAQLAEVLKELGESVQGDAAAVAGQVAAAFTAKLNGAKSLVRTVEDFTKASIVKVLETKVAAVNKFLDGECSSSLFLTVSLQHSLLVTCTFQSMRSPCSSSCP